MKYTILMRLALLGILLLGLVPLATISASYFGDDLKEEEVKAALIYKIARFVAWPDSSFEDKDSKLVVGVYGESKLTAPLEIIFADHRLSCRDVLVKVFDKVEDAEGCHLLFVPGAAKDTEELAKKLAGKPTLFFGESKQFASRGGHVNFYARSGSFRFEINPQAVKRANLEIGAQILKLAKIVKD
jgi:hypothetical protein